MPLSLSSRNTPKLGEVFMFLKKDVPHTKKHHVGKI